MNAKVLAKIASEIYADINRLQTVIDLLAANNLSRHSSIRFAAHLRRRCREQQDALHAEYKRVANKKWESA